MAEEHLPAAVVEQIRQELLREYPEMEGAEMSVTPCRPFPHTSDVAAKVGAYAPEEPAEIQHIVTLRKDVPAEDGIIIPLILRVTVDAQGRIIKERRGRS
ncbi:MAG: hypothetical protein ACP5OO_02090 [Chloroflexia bacterium]